MNFASAIETQKTIRELRATAAASLLQAYEAGVSVNTLAKATNNGVVRVYQLFRTVPGFDPKVSKERHNASVERFEHSVLSGGA